MLLLLLLFLLLLYTYKVGRFTHKPCSVVLDMKSVYNIHSPAAGLASAGRSVLAWERVLCLVALPGLNAKVCWALIPSVSDAGWKSASEAIVRRLNLDALAG